MKPTWDRQPDRYLNTFQGDTGTDVVDQDDLELQALVGKVFESVHDLERFQRWLTTGPDIVVGEMSAFKTLGRGKWGQVLKPEFGSRSFFLAAILHRQALSSPRVACSEAETSSPSAFFRGEREPSRLRATNGLPRSVSKT